MRRHLNIAFPLRGVPRQPSLALDTPPAKLHQVGKAAFAKGAFALGPHWRHRSVEKLQLQRCQYLYFCTSKASKLRICTRPHRRHRSVEELQLQRCQYLYFCTGKASKLRICARPQQASQERSRAGATPCVSIRTCVLVKRVNLVPDDTYLYSCTSKASKLST
jgi:hypothetical protein